MTPAFAMVEQGTTDFDVVPGIRRLLESRHAMHIGEISMQLGVAEDLVRDELEAMRARGEIERLRPVNYPFDDQDFFRLRGEEKAVVEACSRRNGFWIRSTAAAAAACL